jgi:MFS family permease
MALTGVGIGLTVPTLFGVAASTLPPQRFATGAGAVNMIRQIGITVGVAVFVAVVGIPTTDAGELSAFRHGWIAIAGISFACALTAVLLHRPRPAARTAPTGEAARTTAAAGTAVHQSPAEHGRIADVEPEPTG